MGPIGALHKHVRQKGRHQWLGCLLIKKSYSVDRQKSLSDFCAFSLVEQRARLAFHPAHAGIGIEREHQNIPQGAGLFEEPDMARMQQVVAAVGEDDGLTLLFPERALAQQFVSAVKRGHGYQCSSPTLAEFTSGAIRRQRRATAGFAGILGPGIPYNQRTEMKSHD